MATTYSGPSGQGMLQNHTFAQEVIARANDPAPVLDANELALLKRFILKPSSKDEILKERGLNDTNVTDASQKASQQDSLVIYLVANAAAGNNRLTDIEMAELKEWFE